MMARAGASPNLLASRRVCSWRREKKRVPTALQTEKLATSGGSRAARLAFLLINAARARLVYALVGRAASATIAAATTNFGCAPHHGGDFHFSRRAYFRSLISCVWAARGAKFGLRPLASFVCARSRSNGGVSKLCVRSIEESKNETKRRTKISDRSQCPDSWQLARLFLCSFGGRVSAGRDCGRGVMRPNRLQVAAC